MSCQLTTFNFQLSAFLPCTVLVLALMTSCADKQAEKQLTAIDSLTTTVSDLKQKLESVDLYTVRRYSDSTAANLSYVLQNYTDTMGRELSIFLSDYRALRKPLEQFAGQYRRYEERVGQTLQKLSDLRHDMEHRLISDSLYRKYYQNEKQDVRDMQQDLEHAVNMVTTRLRLFDSLNPSVVRMIDSLRAAQSGREEK